MIEEMGVALTKEGPVSMFKDCFADGTTDCGKNYWYRNVHAVNYSCFAVRKSLHEEIGGFRDELDDLAMLEYCMELEKRHYRHTVTPYALVETAGIGEDGMCIRIQKEAKAAYGEFWRRWQLPASDCYYRRR